MNVNGKVVLLVVARFEMGGIPMQAFLWAQFLKVNGYEPIILAPQRKDNRYCDILETNQIRYGLLEVQNKSKGLTGNYRYFKSLIRSIDSYKPYAIFPFNKILSYNINLIWRFTSAKKCYFLERNNGHDEKTTLFGAWIRKLAIWNSGGLIYNSSVAAEQSPYPKKTFVIKNSFVNPLYQNKDEIRVDKIPGVNENTFMVLHIANISRQKNYDLLLDNWEEVKKRYPDWCLVIVGIEVNEKLPEVMKKMDQPGVIYLGSQSNVLPLIKRANLCILSTFYEGCPNVILEYMSQHKVICASDIPSIREVLSVSNYSLLFNNFSADDFLNKVKSAVEMDKSYLSEMATSNFRKLLNDYSESNYKKIVDLLVQ